MSAIKPRRQHSLHWLLRHQRHLVQHKANAVVSGLGNVNVQSQSATLATELSHVARALKTMRSHAIEHHTGLRGTKPVAKGLKQLEGAYDSLARAQMVADPAARFALVAQAVDLLHAAKKSAHHAGADWPL